MPEQDARTAALATLIEYQRTGTFLNVLLSSRLAGSSLQRRDRALVTGLVQGAVRMKLTLDHVLAPFSNRPLGELDPGVRWALRLAAYQVMFMSVPDYAAVDQAARSTAELVAQYAVGYVNAVLRAFVRGYAAVPFPDKDTDPVGYLELCYSHPRWVVEMWMRELGFERAEKVCAADNVEPRLPLRTNLLKVERAALAASLAARDMEVAEGDMTPECLLVRGSGPLDDIPEHRQGMFAVQDQASQLIGHQVAPLAGMRVLDACAAPGGKANHLAELMGNVGEVLAVDLNPERLRMVEDSARRLGNTAVRTLELDATNLEGAVEGPFDRVLLDAPCTGLGTLARRPDARWRKRPADVSRLAELQSRLIASVARLVAPGGLLVYSTCTISQRENSGTVETFAAANKQFRAEPVLVRGERVTPHLMLLPEPAVCDGMFISVLRRSP